MTNRINLDALRPYQVIVPDELVCVVQKPKDIQGRQLDEFCRIKDQYWPHTLEEQRRWWNANSDPDDLLVCLRDDKYLLAFLRLRARTVVCAGIDYSARCATEVCVDQSVVRQGLGRRLLHETIRVLDLDVIPIGYLLCTIEQENFYLKSGWLLASEITMRKTPFEQVQNLDDHKRCFVYDPLKKLDGPILLTGKVF